MEQNKKQEIFDKVWRGAKNQGFQKSVDPGSQICAYRSPNGLKCHAGHLIPDSEYSSRFEGHSVDAVSFFSNQGKDVVDFIYDIQDCHDDAHNPDEIRARLKEFAKKHKLSIPQ